MAYFKDLMLAIYGAFKTPFTIWGHEFSFWGVFILVVLSSIVFWFISELFSG